jgi:hypothetical protein
MEEQGEKQVQDEQITDFMTENPSAEAYTPSAT